ncbi:MAG: lipid-A-disaccharide synthase [Puniceicoccales bacterium]|jgi:lipid-A-disaccharide synthase|nr:lipid-A-disaccharide synthase [Puniceicoccales bacterium]
MNSEINFDFPCKKVELLIIAGEHSGDQHAAEIVKKLKAKHPGLNIYSFGGKCLSEAGAHLILDMTKFSVVGFMEVVFKCLFFRKLLKKIVAWIEKHKPLVICLVDCPGLNFRIARALFEKKLSAKAGGSIKLYYYISPQIWAWKGKRRFKLEKYVDSLGTIFEFEKKAYSDTTLDVKYVGHPFADIDISQVVSYEKDGPVLLLPGSREAAIGKIFPKMLESFSHFSKQEPAKMATVLYASDKTLAIMRKILNKKFQHLAQKVSFIPDGRRVETCAALMSSGTMSLKCCLAGIPGAILYGTSYLTFAIAKRLIKLKYIGIANILLNREAWPEFIQHAINSKVVAKYLLDCVSVPDILNRHENDANELKSTIGAKPEIPPEEWLCAALDAVPESDGTTGKL